jgi:branched-chain amino acid transport system substrate-binding protein
MSPYVSKALSRRTLLRSALVAAPLPLLHACGGRLPDTVRIGVGATLSGPTGARGQDLLNGAILATEQLNAAGYAIAGQRVKFEVISQDDKADVETVRKVAQYLVAEKVSAVIGHVNTMETKAAMPVYAAAGVPQMTTSTNAKLMEQAQGNLLRLVANDNVQATALASFASENLRGQRIAVVQEATEYGRDMFETMQTRLKSFQKTALRVETPYKLEQIATDLGAQVKAHNADVAVVIGRDFHALALLAQLQAVQHTDLTLLVVNPAHTPKLAQTAAPVRSIYATSTTLNASELLGGSEWLAAFKQRFKADPVWGAHYAYEAVNAVANAMQHVRTVDSRKVLADLKSREPNTRYLQQLRFDSRGEQRYPEIGIYRVTRGGWEAQMRASVW